MKARVDVWRAPIGWSGLNVGYIRTHGASFVNVSGICDTKVRMGYWGAGDQLMPQRAKFGFPRNSIFSLQTMAYSMEDLISRHFCRLIVKLSRECPEHCVCGSSHAV